MTLYWGGMPRHNGGRDGSRGACFTIRRSEALRPVHVEGETYAAIGQKPQRVLEPVHIPRVGACRL